MPPKKTAPPKAPAESKAARGKAAEGKPESKAGGELYEDLLAAAAKARLQGELVPHKDGLYTRLRVDGRTVAYIVRGKTVATVYPNALAASAPPDLQFKKVELGAHHYGRGEIIVNVASADDFANAVAMLKASAKMPPVPRSERLADDAPAEAQAPAEADAAVPVEA